jgi:iron complex outermembrane receptor protein
VTSDGVLYYAGVRGFGLPGDYNTRILVLLNGHYLTDNVYGAMYLFGQDFGIDMDLIQRIEVVRGPSSALYGSNGVFATINIFTRTPADAPRGAASTEFGSFGEKKAIASASMYLGKGANLLISAAGFHTSGRRIEAPELGATDFVGTEHGYHTFAHLTWRDWSLTANFAERKVLAPIGWFGADFGDPGTSTRDGHSFVESSWMRQLGKTSTMRWRLYYDQFRYFGRYDYTHRNGSTYDERDDALGDWVGTHLSLHTPIRGVGTLTFGGQVDADLRNLQRTYQYGTADYDRYTSKPDRSYGLFVQQEWNASRRWTFFLGARLDDSRAGSPFVSPRAAAIFRPSERSAYKLLYGGAFRNPSTYERYWEPSPTLGAEKIHTFEFAREQNLGQKLDLVVSAFHYRLTGLIEGVPISESVLQYRNQRESRATGLEVELRGRPAPWLETAASVGLQEAVYQGGDELPNSPDAIVQLRAATPLVRDRLSLAIAGRYLSTRDTPYGWRVDGAPVADATLTTSRLHPQFDLQLGIRNLLNREYFDPMSEEHRVTAFPRAGRSLFLKLLWHYGE